MTAPAKETEHEEITVLLISKVAGELQRTQERTDLSKSDIVNRAITLYDFLEGERDSGTELLLRRRDGSTHRVEWSDQLRRRGHAGGRRGPCAASAVGRAAAG